MYGLDLLSKQEHKLLCAYENIQEDARCFLQAKGIVGKLYYAALTEDLKEFERLYSDYQFDNVDSDD